MYKTIFTYLPSAASAGMLSEIAADLAGKFQAHLIGAHNSVKLVLYGGVPSDYLAEHNQRQREEAESVRASFEQAAQAHGVTNEWRHKALPDTAAFSDIVESARSADLVIAGGKGVEDPLGNWFDLPLRLILETGRPVLLIPEEGAADIFGERVTVAWNQSRESARAAFEALPLLKLADEVRVLSINATENGEENPADDLAAALTRHDVKAVPVATNTTEHSEADELAAELTRANSDLLVMGCYGHSRLREMVLGGVTTHILKHMTIPVLMSH